MKIRSGFVSNSSSASYIVTISKSLEDVIDDMHTHFYLVSDEVDKYKIDKRNYEEILERINKNEKDIWYSKQEIEGYLELIDIIIDSKENIYKQDYDVNKYIETLMEYHRIEIEKFGDITTFTFNTSMHNDYDTSMNRIIKEIVLYYTFEKPGFLNCKIEHTH